MVDLVVKAIGSDGHVLHSGWGYFLFTPTYYIWYTLNKMKRTPKLDKRIQEARARYRRSKILIWDIVKKDI